MKAKKGDWVRIYKIVLQPDERQGSIPDDTKQVPFEMWDKGFLLNDNAFIGDEVEVETIIGRTIKGELIEINPNFEINFGEGVVETLYIGRQLREMLED